MICQWFDEHCPKGNAEREQKIKEATRARANALRRFSRRDLHVEKQSMQSPGVRGQAANVMQPSALRLAPKRSAGEVAMHDEAATRNNCYLCSLNGREPDDCRIAVPGIHPRQCINGHSAMRKSVICP